ncbi:hypothetical protein Sjap_002286 [Stephania japonica]|uniref:FAD-binding PCMH-type domain-containing protein n=1 Tax=Stephania japonica TaxID=461633 RepID=A0AAP0KLL0_9MAGN
MIDLLWLNKVAVDLASKTAWVEGGATLGEIYYAVGTSSNSLGFPAGFCPAVGNGGHIGGGGFGFMSRKYGLASDNVVDAILIDANGKLLDHKSMGEEVFWAIRGGGAGSWGAVYSWKITLVDVPETVTVLQLTRSGSSSDAVKLFNKWQWVAPDLEDEFTLMISVTANSGTSVVTNYKGLYLGPQSSAITSINRVYPELKVVKGECKEMKWVESNVYLADFTKSVTVDALKDRFPASDQKRYYKWKGDYVKKCISVEGIEGIRRREVKLEWGEMCIKEEKIACQKAKLQWLKEGDSNTAFFHRLLSFRRNHNTISKIENVNGVILDESALIEDEILKFFSNQYKSKGERRVSVEDIHWMPINKAQRAQMEIPF